MNSKHAKTLRIQGMTCGHCVKAVKQALESQAGVEVDAVEIGSATIQFDPSQTSLEQLAALIEEEGYAVKQ